MTLRPHYAAYLPDWAIIQPPAWLKISTRRLFKLCSTFILSFTALPGSYGVEEEESERSLGFWYLLQEALWEVEFPPETEVTHEKEMWVLPKAVYAELVAALRTMVRWPLPTTGWEKGAWFPS